jgi:hypothetical protein
MSEVTSLPAFGLGLLALTFTKIFIIFNTY